MASPKKYLILAKKETTQFTDAAPTAATDSMLVTDLQVTPLKVDSESRNLMRPYYGNSDAIPVMEEGQLSFSVEFAGSGAAGTAPKFGVLLRGCAMAETLTASVKAVYNPISSAFEYLTIYAYRDGVLYKFLGAAGTWALDMAAKKIPKIKFTFTGKYAAVTDAAIPGSSDFSAFQRPVASIPLWTGTLTVDSFAAKCAAFSLDVANEVSHAIWMNNETLSVTDRKPKGSITLEAVTIATKDYFTLVRNSTNVVFQLTHGTTAGNIAKVDAPKMQLSSHAEDTYENTLAGKYDLVFNPNAGNDELTLTFS